MRPLRSWIVAIVFFAQILFGLTVQVAVAPQASAATCTSTFASDTLWQPVRNTTGGLLTDPLNDVSGSGGNTNVDIYGTEATSSAAAGSAIDWYSTGTSSCFQFRMRVAATAVSGSKLDNKLWIVGLGTGASTNAWMVVNADNSGNNKVEIYNATPTVMFTYNFTNAGTNSTYAWANTESGSRHYVYWQVPYADLISVLGSSTIYGFFAGTSQSNSFSSINRDCLSVTCTASYTATQKVDLSQDVSVPVSTPVISSLSVTKGTTAGSTSTVITGTNLTNSVRAFIGGQPATIVSFTSTTVTVTTPAGTVGNANVQVETAAGGLSNILISAYKYITAPTATTVAATGLSSTTAQLNGSVNAGNDSTTTSFCWGTASNLTGCATVAAQTQTGTTTNAISYSLTGLTNSTTYYYRALGTNSLGTSTGLILNFTTTAASLSVSSSTPLTSGQVGVFYLFQMSATGGSGTYSSWAITSGSLPSGLAMSSSGAISGTPTATGTTSSIIIQVTDSLGTTASATYSVTINAGPPKVSTLNATSVATTSATLNGNVNDSGASTTVSWCMSTDAAVDAATNALFSCTQISVSASPSTVAAAGGFTAITGSATGLTNLTTYYFQIKAVNSVGTVYGAVISFQTNSKSSQTALTTVLSPTSKTYAYSQVMNNSTTGGSTAGAVTYAIVPGGTATGCLLSDSSATATLTADTSGTCLIVAKMDGNASYNSVTSSSATFTFNKASQTLSFGTTSYSLTYGQSQTVSATGTGTGQVTYSVGASTACTVTGASVTISAGTGTCTVTATIATDTYYNTANSSNSVSITVSKASQTITFGALSNRVLGSGTFTLSATASSALTVAFTSGNEPVCTVSGTTVTLVSAGECTINANQAGNGNYNAATQAPQLFTVAAVLVITTPSSGLSGTYNTAYSLAISSSGGTGTKTFTLFSGTLPTGLSISSSTGTISGTPTQVIDRAITVRVADTASATATTSSFTISIGKASQTLTIAAATLSLSYYATTTITPSGSSGTGSITYTPSSGCSISGTTLTATSSSGSCTLSATIATDTNYSAATSNTLTFTLSTAALTITSTTTSATKVYAATNPTFSFTSSGLKNSETISSITNTFTGTGSYNSATIPSDVGTYTLTPSAAVFAGSASASNYTITYATVAYAITKADQSTLTITSLSGSFGTALTSATTGGNAGAVSFSVANGTNATCSLSGNQLTATAVGAATTGTCLVTATRAGDSNYNSVSSSQTTVTFDAKLSQSLTFAVTSYSKVYGDSTFTVTATPGHSGDGGVISYSSSDDSKCTVGASDGLVTITGAGSCTISAAITAGTAYGAANAATPVTVTISAATSTISILLPASATTATYNAAVTITATVSQAGTVDFKLDGTTITGCGSVATSGTSTITATCSWTPNTTGALALTAVLTPTSSNYSSSTSSTLTVYINYVTFTASVSTTTTGKNVTLTATVTPSSATGTVIFKDGSGAVLCTTGSLSSGSASCVWTTGSAGTYAVSAYYQGSSPYAASTSSSSNIVVNATPTVGGGGNITTSYGTLATSSAFTVSNGTSSYTWSILQKTTNANVPGITIDSSTGVVSASATTTSGTYVMVVTVTDARDATATAEMTVTVSKLSQTVTWSVTSIPNSTSKPYSLSSNNAATTNRDGTISYTVTSAGTSVCSISGTDLTWTGSGSCTLSAIAASTTNYNESSAVTQVFSITSTTTAPSLSPATNTQVINYGSAITTVTVTNSGSAATFTGTVPAGLTLDGSSGSISGTPTTVKTITTYTITATNDAGSATYDFILTVNQATQTISFTTPAAMTVGDSSQALTYSSSSGLTVTLTSNTTSICTISSSSVAAVAAGTCSITASQSGNSNYSAASSVTRTFTITAATAPPSGDTKSDPDLSWSDPSNISSGTALSSSQLNASASVPGRYSYSPASGTVLPVGSHTLSVRFTPTNTTRYNSVSTSVTIIVTGRAATPTPTPTPTPIIPISLDNLDINRVSQLAYEAVLKAYDSKVKKTAPIVFYIDPSIASTYISDERNRLNRIYTLLQNDFAPQSIDVLYWIDSSDSTILWAQNQFNSFYPTPRVFQKENPNSLCGNGFALNWPATINNLSLERFGYVSCSGNVTPDMAFKAIHEYFHLFQYNYRFAGKGGVLWLVEGSVFLALGNSMSFS